jgi:hypothetical protein
LLKDELPLGDGMNPEAMDLGLPDGSRETHCGHQPWPATVVVLALGFLFERSENCLK